MANNKKRGNKYELNIGKRFAEALGLEFGKDVKTARYSSREMDDKGVDLIIEDSDIKPQIKLTSTVPQVKKYLEKSEANVLIWGRCEKANKNSVVKAEYAILPLDDYFELLKSTK